MISCYRGVRDTRLVRQIAHWLDEWDMGYYVRVLLYFVLMMYAFVLHSLYSSYVISLYVVEVSYWACIGRAPPAAR